MSKISIIVPIYNGKKSIKRCLKSIAKQTFTDFELILIDDGSKDDSLNIAENLVQRSEALKERTKIISRDNSGAANTRNYGIKEATGEFVAFIDQDDVISKDYLKNYYNATLEKEVDIVYGGYERVSEEGRILFKIQPSNSEWGRYIVVSPWAHLYRRSFIVDNCIEFLDNNIGEDIYFNVVAINNTDKYIVVKDRGYKWIYNSSSVSNSIQSKSDNRVDVLKLLNSIYDKVETGSSELRKDNNEYLEYFFLRYVCWYLLFSSRGSKKEEISRVISELFLWIKERYPRYRKNRYINLYMPKGENIKFYLFVRLFYLLERIHLLNSVLRLFGRK